VAKAAARDGHTQLRRGGEEFGFYRKLVSRWNQKSRSTPGHRSLAVCLPFLLTARELEIMDQALQAEDILR
jgi:hypothetical protein